MRIKKKKEYTKGIGIEKKQGPTRVCKVCKIEKPNEEMSQLKGGKYKGVRKICKICDASISRDWYKNNIERKKDYDLKRHFGIGIKEYKEMLEKQNNSCAICKQKETSTCKKGNTMRMAVDHCHTTGKIRGILCSNCNKGIGSLKDSIDNLKNAIIYLTKETND